MAVVLLDMKIPEGRLIFDGVELRDEPMFTISTAAQVFFARGTHWMRWAERGGFFDYEGERPGSRTESGARLYSLPDIEKMAHGLALHEKIDSTELKEILYMVMLVARRWGWVLIPKEELDEG